MDRFRSLTARLVLTAVALVALVSVTAGAATTWAVRAQLLDQLDQKVLSSVGRLDDGPGFDGNAPQPGRIGNQGPGTLLAFIDTAPDGFILGDRPGDETAIDAGDLAVIARITPDD